MGLSSRRKYMTVRYKMNEIDIGIKISTKYMG